MLSAIVLACASHPRRINGVPRPTWNLDVVLRVLSRPPYAPLRGSAIRDLTTKSLFLPALATAQWVGVVQALSSRTSWRGQDLLVCYLPEFIAKTDTGAHSTPREFCVKSLASLVGFEDEERLLCPVRALSHYLKRTAAASRDHHLFLAVRCPSRPMSKAAVSFFLRDTINSAHEAVSDSTCRELKVRAHDIRGVAASMLLWMKCPV